MFESREKLSFNIWINVKSRALIDIVWCQHGTNNSWNNIERIGVHQRVSKEVGVVTLLLISSLQLQLVVGSMEEQLVVLGP